MLPECRRYNGIIELETKDYTYITQVKKIREGVGVYLPMKNIVLGNADPGAANDEKTPFSRLSKVLTF